MASKRVRVAARLSEWFPLLAAAMDRGELSFAHAARLIRSAAPEVLDGLQSIEPDLVVSLGPVITGATTVCFSFIGVAGSAANHCSACCGSPSPRSRG